MFLNIDFEYRFRRLEGSLVFLLKLTGFNGDQLCQKSHLFWIFLNYPAFYPMDFLPLN